MKPGAMARCDAGLIGSNGLYYPASQLTHGIVTKNPKDGLS